jgi:hypothetical protein
VGLHVRRLGADAEGDGNLADRVPGCLGLEEPLDERPGACAVMVDLERGEQVDRLALPLLGD